MSTNPTPTPSHDAVTLQDETLQHASPEQAPQPKARVFWVLRTAWWLVLLGLGLWLMLQRAVLASQQPNDFCQDYLAAHLALQGLSPYALLTAAPGYHACLPPLLYDSHPPFSVLLALPLGLLSRAAASLLWALLALGCYLATGGVLLRKLGWWSARGAALFVMGSLFWTPFRGSVDAQNFSELLLVLILGAWLLERKGHLGWAGALLGLAALLKIWPLLLLAAVLARREWKVALVGAATVVAGTLAALAAFGLRAYADYLGPVLHQESGDVPHEVNVSLVGALTRPWTGFHDPGVLAFSPLLSGLSVSEATALGEGVAALLALGVLALIVWAQWRASGEAVEALCLGLLVTALMLSFPITWNWGVVTLLLPLGTTALALQHAPRPPRWWGVLVGLSLALLVNPEWVPFLLAGSSPRWASVLFGLPTLALLVFAVAQAQLLFWLARPQPK